MKKKKKRKVNVKKLLSRVLLLVIIIALLIIIIKSIGKKDKQKYDISIIVNNENITNNLSHEPYINKDNVLYLSIEDTSKIFDKNIYYEKDSGKIITTSGTKVAAIDVVNNIFELNNASLIISNGVLDYGNTYYIPISELTNIYNIETNVKEKSAVISSLYKELITVKTTKKNSLKEKTSGFSHTIQKLEPNTELIYLEDADKKGWYKVLSYDGKVGYIKSKKVTEKETKRTNMEDEDFTGNIPNVSNAIEINKDKLNAEALKNFSARKTIVEETIGMLIRERKTHSKC